MGLLSNRVYIMRRRKTDYSRTIFIALLKCGVETLNGVTPASKSLQGGCTEFLYV